MKKNYPFCTPLKNNKTIPVKLKKYLKAKMTVFKSEDTSTSFLEVTF